MRLTRIPAEAQPTLAWRNGGGLTRQIVRVGAALTLAGDRKSARRVSRDVQTRWREFARTGVPGADWPRYSADERALRVFDRRSRVEIDPHSARRSACRCCSRTLHCSGFCHAASNVSAPLARSSASVPFDGLASAPAPCS